MKKSQDNKHCNSNEEPSLMTTPEHIRRIQRINAVRVAAAEHERKPSARFLLPRVAKRLIIAASIILLLCGTTLTAGAAIEGLSIGEYLSFVIQNLKPGESIDKDGYTFEYLGENKQYTDIKDVLAEHNLDIMYPSVLPDGVAIEKIYLTEAFSGEEKGELIITFNDKDISCVISRKNQISFDPVKYEKYTTDYLVFYLEISAVNELYQATALTNGIEYVIVCSNYEQLITLMKGFTK